MGFFEVTRIPSTCTKGFSKVNVLKHDVAYHKTLPSKGQGVFDPNHWILNTSLCPTPILIPPSGITSTLFLQAMSLR